MAGGDAPSGDDGTLEYCLYGQSISAGGWAIVQRAASEPFYVVRGVPGVPKRMAEKALVSLCVTCVSVIKL